MLVIPAIDIEKNKVARLFKGNYDKVTYYKESPSFLVKKFIEMGAKRIHIVLLSGAKEGKLSEKNTAIVKEVIETRDKLRSQCRIQLGGGIRSSKQIDFFFSSGVNYIIMGTSLLIPVLMEEGYSIRDLKFLYQQAGKTFEMEKEVPEIEILDNLDEKVKKRIIVALDFRNDELGISGWNVTIPVLPEFMMKKFIEKGFSRFLITNIEKDGTLEGIDPLPIERIIGKAQNWRENIKEILVAGGIKDENDLIVLNSLEHKPDGVVIGKAIYNRKIDIEKAISDFQNKNQD